MSGNCESCTFFSFDDEFEEYYCQVNLDEDEMMRFIADEFRECPYYRLEDEYKTVRKQM